eukprot:TRINITY_DN45036_c0_g1_i1.p3 TRINITY_DN45036_c0_g1~~TRINITY_DN45036_c0_g1_i1.p3  ORF type:complete len:186 (+),score=49.54 TRINITY_DN45036_c0_g1_i1:302-859(+)
MGHRNWMPPTWLVVTCVFTAGAGLLVAWLFSRHATMQGLPLALCLIGLVITPLGLVAQACLAATRNGRYLGLDVVMAAVALAGATFIVCRISTDFLIVGCALLGVAALHLALRILTYFTGTTPYSRCPCGLQGEEDDAESCRQSPPHRGQSKRCEPHTFTEGGRGGHQPHLGAVQAPSPVCPGPG